MWYKINKLTTLMYPQYTRGEKIKGRNNLFDYEFEAPFSQVYGSTPVVRIRIGDLVKSNYSKLAAARLFGLGSSKNFNITSPNPLLSGILFANTGQINTDSVSVSEGIFYYAFLALTASPAVAVSQALSIASSKLSGVASAVASPAVPIVEAGFYDALALLDPVDGRGYVNPFVLGQIRNRLLDPQSYRGQQAFFSDFGNLNQSLSEEDDESLLNLFGSITTVFPVTSGWNTKPDGKGEKIIFYQPLKGVLTRKIVTDGSSLREEGGNALRTGKDLYQIRIIEGDLQGQKIWVPRGGFSFDSQGFMQGLFALSNPVSAGLDFLQSQLENNTKLDGSLNVEGAVRDALNVLTNPTAAFFSSFDNPYFKKNEVIAGFEKNMGRGLAGVIENMSFGWDFAWETEFGSRAPMGCKVTLKFSPIHDIPPGLDADGFNRAPIYNAGRIMNDFSGDPVGKENSARAAYTAANKQVK
jgi:hypothetical protein